MRELFKHFYKNATAGHLLLYPVKKLYDIYRIRLLPEKIYLKKIFKLKFGFNIDLENPKTIHEKLIWLRLNERNPLHTLCADKYAVRNYIKDKIGEKYLIPLVFQTDNPADIYPENLPDYPFIIKTNHGCSGEIIVKDKSQIDWEKVRKNLKKSLKSNFYYKGKEWQYKNIEPCIVVEKLLLNNNFEIYREYQLTCCNGQVKFIEVQIDKYANKKLNFYDPDWNILDCRVSSVENSEYCEKPVMLDKMKSLAEVLARDFIFVRVDLYNFGSEIYFGELTFTPVGGFQKYIPSKWNRIFGDKLIINKSRY